MRVQRSIEIAAPPEKIWPFLIDPEKILKWCITFRKFEYPGEQRSGVGTLLYIEEKVDGPMPLMKLNFTMMEWAENKKITFSMTSGNFAKGYEQSWTVETIPDGSRFTFAENFKLPFGVIGKLIGLIGQRGSEATVGKMLPILKSLVEAQ